MTIKDALNWASKTISPLESEILLAYVLKKDKVWLYKNPDYKISPTQKNKYQKLIQRRQKGEPIAYITNHKEFYGLDFYVDKRVLIPRPETEILVEEVLKIANRQSLIANRLTIADIGTGSGCISVAIATKLKTKKSDYSKLKIYATDISKKALEVAKMNAKKHQVLDKIRTSPTARTFFLPRQSGVEIKFLHGDLLLPLPEKVDFVVANIPYVATDYSKFPDFDDINSFEPKIALFGGKDGLDLIKELLKQAPKYLNKNGKIFLEISYHQKKILEKIIPQYLPGYSVKFKKDLSGLYRIAHIFTQKGKGVK